MRRKGPIYILTAVIALLGMLAAGCGNTASSVVLSEYLPNDKAIVVTDKSQYHIQIDPQEQQILAEMELLLENKEAALYIGSYYDIAVLDKGTGKVFFSNRQLYQEESKNFSQDQQNNAFSQLVVEYLDGTGRIAKMTSFPQCYDNKEKDQVTIQKGKDEVDVHYYFGTKTEDKLICQVFTPETFEKFKKIGEQMREKGSLSRSDWGRFISTYNYVEYDKLSEKNQKEYLKKYPALKEYGALYIINPTATYIQLNVVEKVSKALGITKADIEKEEQAVGETDALQSGTPNFEITINYRLQGADLIVTVDPKKVVEPSKSYLHKIYVLPFFGGTQVGNEGYLFVPDGSGAIISNQSQLSGVDNLEIPFYGTDYAGNVSSVNDLTPESTFPVFGLKEDNTAVFGIVESNDGMSGITAQVSNPNYPDNLIMPWFIYRNYYNVDTGDTMTGLNNVMFSKKTPTSVYAVRYHFLYGQDATYSGMANYFRTYLEQTGILTEKQEKTAIPVDIELLGSIRKKAFRYGIPMEVNVGLSTFEEAASFIDYFSGKQKAELSLNYTGIFNGGLEFRSYNKIKLENVIGGKKGFQNLLTAADNSDTSIYLQMAFNHVYQSGNGIKSSSDLSRQLNKKYAVVSEFHPSSGKLNEETQAFLISPLSFSGIVNGFLKNVASLNNSKIYLDETASLLCSNYNESREVTREEAKALTQKALEQLEKAGMAIKISGGNLYTLPYVSAVTNIPIDSGNQRLITNTVPFVGMVLHGMIDYSGTALNKAGDYRKALLQNLESGAGLNYQLMTGDTGLLAKTKYTEFYSVSDDVWKEKILTQIEEQSQFYYETSDCTIMEHLILQSGVVQVRYSNGKSIVLNYNETAIRLSDGREVEALGYLIK